MNNRRPTQQDRGLRWHSGSVGREDHSHRQMGESSQSESPFAAHSDWRGSGGWDAESRGAPQMGAGDDRFGGYTGGYDVRANQQNARRAQQWDEDRFGYPEPERHRHDLHGGSERGSQHTEGDDWSRGPDRYYWHNRYGGGAQHRPNGPSDFAPRGAAAAFRMDLYSPRASSMRSDRFGPHEWSEASFAGGSNPTQRGGVRSYGIASGSETGGYGFDSRWRDDAHPWSGSRWASDQDPRSRAGEQGFSSVGRAPKGYTRSDERIRDDVCEMLYRAYDVDVSNVSVESTSGTITLEGTVPDRRMKHRIEDLCEHCLGVNDVDNRIRVVREQEHSAGSTPELRSPSSADTQLSGSGTPNDRATAAKKGSSSSPH